MLIDLREFLADIFYLEAIEINRHDPARYGGQITPISIMADMLLQQQQNGMLAGKTPLHHAALKDPAQYMPRRLLGRMRKRGVRWIFQPLLATRSPMRQLAPLSLRFPFSITKTDFSNLSFFGLFGLAANRYAPHALDLLERDEDHRRGA
jgi:hypothetical protein